MLLVENRESLKIESRVLPIIEQIAQCLTDGDPVQLITRIREPLHAIPGWIVFMNDNRQGIAINAEGLFPSQSTLRLRIQSLQNAHKVIQTLGGSSSFPLSLSDRSEYPEEWIVYQITFLKGTLLCALSSQLPSFHPDVVQSHRILPRVSLSLVSFLHGPGLLSVGDVVEVSSLAVQCLEQRISGFICGREGGIMSVEECRVRTCDDEELSEASEKTGALIRLDIGEIELTLEELVALRAGSSLELQTEMPVRCFMRIGSTILGQGELSVREEGGLRLCIKEVVS